MLKKIAVVFILWRILLVLFLLFSYYLPLQKDFLGGGLDLYMNNPFLWAHLNFDGEHYLSIATIGYQPLTYFFFPLYPLLIRLTAVVSGGDYLGYVYSGLIISHLSFLLALFGLFKLVKIDFGGKVAWSSVILLLLFPTSFYFVNYYTESLFLFFTVWSFYFARKNKWILAGILGFFSSLTRLIGIALFPAMLSKISNTAMKKQKLRIKAFILPIICTLLIPAGTIFYMIFLKIKTGDPLEFLHSVEIFGDQRSSSLILLPQVFYRYIFKILPGINYGYFPVVFTSWFEFLTSVLLLALSLLAIFASLGKIRGLKFPWSYTFYIILGFLTPTLSGSFSSLPRYAVVLFPVFILMAIMLKRFSRSIQLAFYALLFICLSIASAMYFRGYWVS